MCIYVCTLFLFFIVDIGAAGDRRQVQAVSMHQQQPSTSTKSPNVRSYIIKYIKYILYYFLIL